MSYTYDYPMPAITTDIVVVKLSEDFNKEPSILLIKRKNDPFKDCWALPGGHLDAESDETIHICAQRELKEETNIDANLKDLIFIDVCGDIGRDPRGRYITHVYRFLFRGGEIKAADDATEARWFPLRSLPPLAFDHRKLITKALTKD